MRSAFYCPNLFFFPGDGISSQEGRIHYETDSTFWKTTKHSASSFREGGGVSNHLQQPVPCFIARAQVENHTALFFIIVSFYFYFSRCDLILARPSGLVLCFCWQCITSDTVFVLAADVASPGMCLILWLTSPSCA